MRSLNTAAPGGEAGSLQGSQLVVQGSQGQWSAEKVQETMGVAPPPTELGLRKAEPARERMLDSLQRAAVHVCVHACVSIHVLSFRPTVSAVKGSGSSSWPCQPFEAATQTLASNSRCGPPALWGSRPALRRGNSRYHTGRFLQAHWARGSDPCSWFWQLE